MTAVAMLPRAMLCHCLTPSRRCCAVVRSGTQCCNARFDVSNLFTMAPLFSTVCSISSQYLHSTISEQRITVCRQRARGSFRHTCQRMPSVSAHAVSVNTLLSEVSRVSAHAASVNTLLSGVMVPATNSSLLLEACSFFCQTGKVMLQLQQRI